MKIADIELVDETGRIHVADAQVAAIAEQILECFKEDSGKYLPRNVRVKDKDLSHFYRAAEECIKEGLTPRQYTRRQLNGMAHVNIFYPAAIASKEVAQKATQSHVTLDAISHYRAQFELFASRCNLYGPELAVRDKANPFTPLFRCLIANRLGLTDLLNEYCEAARIELETAPIAREAFAGSLGFLGNSSE